MCSSILNIFSIDVGTMSLLLTFLSTANITPSFDTIPTDVVPLFTASLAYSIWNKRPSGLNTVKALSYP